MITVELRASVGRRPNGLSLLPVIGMFTDQATKRKDHRDLRIGLT